MRGRGREEGARGGFRHSAKENSNAQIKAMGLQRKSGAAAMRLACHGVEESEYVLRSLLGARNTVAQRIHAREVTPCVAVWSAVLVTGVSRALVPAEGSLVVHGLGVEVGSGEVCSMG